MKTPFETGAKTARANDIVLTLVNDGDGSQCGLDYDARRTASLARIRIACRHYLPTASNADIDDAAILVKAYYDEVQS